MSTSQLLTTGKQNILEQFISYKKGTKGLTASGEKWLRVTLGPFLEWLSTPLEATTRTHIAQFLARYEDKPWRKHSFYRALKTFFKWTSLTYSIPNPFIDQFGNSVIEAPKTPDKVLYTMTPDNVALLIGAASSVRDKAILSLLADSGVRRSEIVSIAVADLNLEDRRIKVMGKGNKEGYLVFGEKTKDLLLQHISSSRPTEMLFGLTSLGLQAMLYKLEKRTGTKCCAHSFRRGFATELRRQGVNELDITQLGRWSDVSMVKRYTKAYTFDDAAKRYKAIVT